jgi:methylmalonyl-CoA/ethylmalonyl-CoA epimerase
MPSGPFAHVCLLVKDLDKAIEDWTKILGILDPASLEKRIVKYDEFSSGEDQGMKWATFVNEYSTEIQFIQPSPDTPLGKRLEKIGEHVHQLKEEGLQVIEDGKTYNDPDMPWQTWSWLGPKSAHGVLIEVAKPYESRDDGKWHPAPGKFAYKKQAAA